MDTRRIIAFLAIALLLSGLAWASEETHAEDQKISIWGGYAGEAVWKRRAAAAGCRNRLTPANRQCGSATGLR